MPLRSTAPKGYHAQQAFLHPVQYAFLAVAAVNLIQNDKSGAALFGIISLSFERGFQSVCTLAARAKVAAALDNDMPNYYSLPTRFGLKLFDGLSTSIHTVTTAVQSGIANIEKEFSLNNNGPQ